MAKTTKEELIGEVAVLRQKVNRMVEDDVRLRTDFSKLLGNSVKEFDGFGGGARVASVVYSWETIAGLLGRLQGESIGIDKEKLLKDMDRGLANAFDRINRVEKEVYKNTEDRPLGLDR